MSNANSKDIFSKEKRSLIMSRVRSQNTNFELAVFGALKRSKIRFSKHYSKIPGKPDIVIVSKKIAVFLDSDFWHGWRYPQWRHKLNGEFWTTKIETNRKRDLKVNKILRKTGWKVLRIWEHQLKKDEAAAVERIIRFLSQ